MLDYRLLARVTLCTVRTGVHSSSPYVLFNPSKIKFLAKQFSILFTFRKLEIGVSRRVVRYAEVA